jgi:hypothetical protein
MTQKDNTPTTPTRKWEMEELLDSRLMNDMEFQVMLYNQSPLTRERYLSNSYGISEEEVTGEIEAYLPWDFQDPESRIPWEETEEPTIRDLQEYGLI